VLGYLRTPAVYFVHDCVVHDRPRPRRYAGDWSGWWSTALDGVDPVRATLVRALRAADERNTRRASRLLANSRFTAENVASHYGLEAHVCYLGVDTHAFRPVASAKRQGVVLSVGAVRDGKGFDFLVEALARIPSGSRPALRVVANVDYEPERRRLAETARQRGVDLRFEIGVADETLVARYNEARLVVYAPVLEPFGLVSLEAMACGVPVVGVREGGVAETVVDGVTGRLVGRDESEFAEAVATLLADEPRRLELGREARRHALERWSWEDSALRLEHHLAAAAGLAQQAADDPPALVADSHGGP
jgi:glycosyltransferase involved in cell wall biosynthesis